MSVIHFENMNTSLNIDADQIITFLEKVKQSEETKYEQNNKLLNTIGMNLENFDENVLEQLNTLSKLQYQLGCNDTSHTNLVLHAVDRKYDDLKQQRQINKVDIEIKKITKFAEKIVEQTETLQREYKILQDDLKLLKVNPTEQKELQEKFKRYKAGLKKLEDDLHKYNLPEHNIMKYEQDIENLKKLQRKKIELSEKLAKYMGASPDIDILCKQIEEIELQYKEYQQKFSNLF